MSLRDGVEAVKEGQSWVLRPMKDGWAFEKSFPTKWKAELALATWEAGGRVSDYWRAARKESATRRAGRSKATNSEAPMRADAPTQPANDVEHAEQPDEDFFSALLAGLGGCLVMWLGIFGPPLLFFAVVLALLFFVPLVGQALVVVLGGLFAAVLAGAGTRGAHPTWSGGWRYSVWGRRGSSWQSVVAFLAGALLTWGMLFG